MIDKVGEVINSTFAGLVGKTKDNINRYKSMLDHCLTGFPRIVSSKDP
jgi:hypothetical protein